MNTRVFILAAIFDTLLMFLVMAYGVRTAATEAAFGMLFFYLGFVMVALGKIPVWSYIFRLNMDEERERRKDTGLTDDYSKGGGAVPRRPVDPVEWHDWNRNKEDR